MSSPEFCNSVPHPYLFGKVKIMFLGIEQGQLFISHLIFFTLWWYKRCWKNARAVDLHYPSSCSFSFSLSSQPSSDIYSFLEMDLAFFSGLEAWQDLVQHRPQDSKMSPPMALKMILNFSSENHSPMDRIYPLYHEYLVISSSHQQHGLEWRLKIPNLSH